MQQPAVQQALDPQTWVETVKTGARGTANQINVAFDDSTNVNYTTQTAQTLPGIITALREVLGP